MALKRINKELTDLGRCVNPPGPLHGHPCAQPQAEAVSMPQEEIHTYEKMTVTLPLRAQQDLSAMISYVISSSSKS